MCLYTSVYMVTYIFAINMWWNLVPFLFQEVLQIVQLFLPFSWIESFLQQLQQPKNTSSQQQNYRCSESIHYSIYMLLLHFLTEIYSSESIQYVTMNQSLIHLKLHLYHSLIILFVTWLAQGEGRGGGQWNT